MRWEVNYVNKQYRVCVKEIEPGTVSGMTTMSLRLRADSRHHLWVQINEKSGEKFYRIVTAELKWREPKATSRNTPISWKTVADSLLR